MGRAEFSKVAADADTDVLVGNGARIVEFSNGAADGVGSVELSNKADVETVPDVGVRRVEFLPERHVDFVVGFGVVVGQGA